MSNKVIYKFPAPHRLDSIEVRVGARVVLVDHQYGVPTIWVEMDLWAPREVWRIFSVATGEEHCIQDSWGHLGSVVVRPEDSNGSYKHILVWHLYKENM